MTITVRSYLLTLNTNTLLPIASLNINDTQTIHTCVPIIFSWAWNYLYSKVCCKQLIANLFLGGSGENVLSSQNHLWQRWSREIKIKGCLCGRTVITPVARVSLGQSFSSLLFNVPLSWHGMEKYWDAHKNMWNLARSGWLVAKYWGRSLLALRYFDSIDKAAACSKGLGRVVVVLD